MFSYRRRDGLGLVRKLTIGVVISVFLSFALSPGALAQEQDAALKFKAREAMERAATFFRDKLSVAGTYVWSYSADLSVRRGEGGKVENSIGWVQPPGTPAIGAAYLRVYEVTGDEVWLTAARDTASALIGSQLLSGGWFMLIETDPTRRTSWCYLSEGVTSKEACKRIAENKLKDRSLLDDNTTQSVLSFLIWVDEKLNGQSAELRQSIDYGLERLLRAQYPNGAWPILLDRATEDNKIVVDQIASLPIGDWPREWVKPNKPPYFILNDNAVRDVIRLLLSAERRYGKQEYLKAAIRGGNFLLAAQLPAPHRGWAQTYDSDLRPVWGRKFEPPALSSKESAGAVDVLLQLYSRTGEQKYLDGARAGAAWLRSARLPDGEWARFYELGTNRPLYIDPKEKITYEDANLLEGYGLKGDFNVQDVLVLVDRIGAGQPDATRPYWASPVDLWSDDQLEAKVRKLVKNQDADGRWVEDDWINSGTFVEGIFALARYASRP